MPTIILKNLVKRYGTTSVIRDLSLTMTDREFTVIVGPSGCGKSTVLRLIAGLETATAGEIWIDGREMSQVDPGDRDIAMVFQDYALYPHMSVFQNMAFALKLKHLPAARIRARVSQIAELLAIETLLERRPAELSGGQRQRVAMGRALVRDAAIYLFDEPLSSLDAKLRATLRAELAMMRARMGKNTIYVTHDQVEAMMLGDRIVVMNDGTIQQQGTPEELYKRPANLFVASFIGSPPVSLLEGQITQSTGGLRVTGNGFDLPVSEAHKQALLTHTSGDVIIGIRPAALCLAVKPLQRMTTGHTATLRLDILRTDYMGAQSTILAHCADQPVTVEIATEYPLILTGSHDFQLDTQALLFFDRQSGVNIR